jgi:hypothetical protein
MRCTRDGKTDFIVVLWPLALPLAEETLGGSGRKARGSVLVPARARYGSLLFADVFVLYMCVGEADPGLLISGLKDLCMPARNGSMLLGRRGLLWVESCMALLPDDKGERGVLCADGGEVILS